MPRGSKPLPPGASTRQRAEWHITEGGWKHPLPDPPDVTAVGLAAWSAWFESWWAANWTLEDLPALRLTCEQFDMAARGSVDVTKLIPLLDRYGITPKGRQDLRWAPPKGVVEDEVTPGMDELEKKRSTRKANLA